MLKANPDNEQRAVSCNTGFVANDKQVATHYKHTPDINILIYIKNIL